MNVQEHESPLMRVAEAAALLGCTPRTVHRHIELGNLRAVRLGERGQWRVVRRGVDSLVMAEAVTDSSGKRVKPTNGGSSWET